MEYIEGLPITRYCDERRLDVRERLKLVQAVCEAVQHAHQNLIVHRDIKPSNILVTKEGIPKLLDFGISKLLARSPHQELTRTMTALRIATPQYASPEVVRGEPASTAMDIYSVGLILYELLTGHRPYELRLKSQSQIERTICDEEPLPPSTAVTRVSEIIDSQGTTSTIDTKSVSALRSCVPQELLRSLRGDLDNVIHKALHKDASRRYASIEQLSQDIERYLTGFPVHARRDTFGYRAQKFIRRHRFGVVAAALIFSLLIIAITGTTYGLTKANREAVRARSEAAKARQISNILQSMLASANPQEGHRDMKVRQVLDSLAIGIKRELADQPDVLAEILSTIGTSYLGLGMPIEAESYLQDALEIRTRLHGDIHEQVAESLIELGEAKWVGGDYEESERLLNRALSLNRQLFGSNHPAVVQSLSSLGQFMHKRSRYLEAESLLRQAVSIARAVYGAEHPKLADTLQLLGLVLSQRGQFAQALRYCQEALTILKAHFGDRHPRVSQCLSRLAIVYQQSGDYGQAKPLHRQALMMERDMMGDRHPRVARVLHNLGTLLHDQGHTDEAVAMLKEALSIRREVYGQTHATIAITLNNLATMLDPAEALPVLQESLVISRKIFGNDHLYVATTLQNLAALHRTRSDYSSAEPHYVEALSLFENILGKQHLRISYPLVGLGECLLRRGDASGAEIHLRRAYDLRKRAYPPPATNPLLASCESALGECMIQLKRWDEAQGLLLSSYDFYKNRSDELPDERQLVRERLVQLYLSWDKPETADKYRSPK